MPSPRHLKGEEVFSDENGYPCLNPQYFLLNCSLSEEEIKERYPTLWHYLHNSINTTARKYLCKNRKVWFHQEQRSATAFLCSYMGRGNSKHSTPFRFILNHTNAIATNSYLMLYPKTILREAIEQNPAMLRAVWHALRNISADELENEGRVYGGGLKKIEPGELSNVKCPHLCELLANE